MHRLISLTVELVNAALLSTNGRLKLADVGVKNEHMSDWSSGSCEANGINIHYLRTGEHRLPVVLLHGLIASVACWTPVAQALAEEYDVIMPDARGHGKSSV